MTSEVRGAVMFIMKEAIHAVHTPCHNHILNLSISRSSNVQAIRKAVGVMQEVISFFTVSDKRSGVLKQLLGHTLSDLCETRWIEHHNGVNQFRESLPKIIKSLKAIEKWNDSTSSSKARTLRIALIDTETLVAIICLSDILSCTKQLSEFFQRTGIDLKCAQEMLSDTLKVLKRKRDHCEIKFKTLYQELQGIAEEIDDIELRVPRKVKRQKHRDNYPSDDPLVYYRQAIYIPMIEYVIEDLKSRFPDETLEMYNLSILFPSTKKSSSEDILHAVRKIAIKYCAFFNQSADAVQRLILSELEFWKLKLEREKGQESHSAIHFFKMCDMDLFPCIHFLLKIFITLPYSNASAERTFSSLRRIKTWLRSTMGQERLTGLALMHVHHQIELDPDRIIDKYANKNKHRLEFVL